MSEKLAISSALSVLMMSAFVLFGPVSASEPMDLRPPMAALPSIELPAAAFSALLPALR